MSNIGGVFTLITNNGVQDKLIMAADKLLQRISIISKDRLINLRAEHPNLSDEEIARTDYNWMPKLSDIEKTHLIP